MEFVVNKRDFVKGLSRVQSVADKKSAMPILGNVLIVAESGGSVRLSATDLLLSVTGSMRAEVKKPGSVALHARHIFDAVKALPDGDITVTVEKNYTARLKAVKRRFDFTGMPGEDFPTRSESISPKIPEARLEACRETQQALCHRKLLPYHPQA